MADLIDRDAIFPLMERKMDMQELYLPVHFIDFVINEIPSVNQWIPCSERLPEKHTEVLAYSPFWGKIVVALWGGEYWLEQWTDDDLQSSEITHWMPLPEPPESEVQNDDER